MNALTKRILSNIYTVLPIIVIVLISHFLFAPLQSYQLARFGIGTIFLIIGLTLFLIGVDLAIAPLGQLTGVALVKTNKLWMVVVGGILLGFFISVAEPGLLVMAAQISQAAANAVSSLVVVVIVSIGMAVMVAFGFLRIVYGWPLYIVLLLLYGLIFLLALFADPTFIAIAFDTSGATTGVLAVPFILALAFGISTIRKDSKGSEKDSFGLVAIASTGPVFAILLLNLFDRTLAFGGTYAPPAVDPGILMAFIRIMPDLLLESLVVLAPLVGIFIILNQWKFKLKRRPFTRIIKGFIYVLIGLFIFLVGVNGGFMEVGLELGVKLMNGHPVPLFIIAFLLGAMTIIAEPAVHVLTQQIEDVTAGHIKPKAVYAALALGVGIALVLTVIRIIVPGLQVWHFILPSFFIALLLMFFTPKVFVAIGFDAGGVATGPIIVSFIVSFVQGIASQSGAFASIADGFGMIALVAVIPIITLEVLGIIYRINSAKGGV
jgi:hypothetical protein